MMNTIGPCLLLETVSGIDVIGFAVPAIVSEETIHEVAEQLSELIETSGSKKLLLNFHDVQFMSGRMLSVQLWVARKIERDEGSMKLCCIAPHILGHFEVTRLHRYFEIFSDEPVALGSFSQLSWIPCAF